MSQTLTALPVAVYDNHEKHGESHRAFMIPLQSLADMGDENAAQQVAVIEQHLQMHVAQAESATENVALTPEDAIQNPPMDSEQGQSQLPSIPDVPPV